VAHVEKYEGVSPGIGNHGAATDLDFVATTHACASDGNETLGCLLGIVYEQIDLQAGLLGLNDQFGIRFG
jgi:hypothetical protein